MTTQQPDKITAAEIRQQFDALHALVDSMRGDLETLIAAVNTMRDGIQHAASATPPAAAGTFGEMEINEIVMTYDDAGKPAYKARGAPYQKFGVRVWDEILPALGIDHAALKLGPNAIPPIRARVLIAKNNDGKQYPRKVTGKA